MKGFRKAPASAVIGTSLQGYVRASYSKIKARFGTPTKGDGYKVDAEWVFYVPTGEVATIYNYKNGKNYLGKQGKPLSAIKQWHIGGKSRKVVQFVQAALK